MIEMMHKQRLPFDKQAHPPDRITAARRKQPVQQLFPFNENRIRQKAFGLFILIEKIDKQRDLGQFCGLHLPIDPLAPIQQRGSD